MNSYTLGLDIGSKSIGWALLQDGKKQSIVDIGVRVFPEGVERDTKGLEKSKNATRREARGARRTRYRSNLRRDQLVKTLRSAGLLPKDKIALREILKRDPYKLRARGLDEKLELYEFGRALFHINQRRGFKSNRKTGEAKEDGKVVKEASELQEKIDKTGCRTLGEYFANVNPEENRIREQYTYRSMYEREFDLLWENQAKFYPEVLTEELQKKIRDEIIFLQRPLKPTDELIGNCELEPGEKRCPRGDWYARRFRMLQDVNNIKVYAPDGSVRALSEDERHILLDELSKKKEVKFSAIRKKLGLLETQKFNAEYEVNEKGKKNEKLSGDIYNAAMRNKKIFGPKVWDAMGEAEKIKLNDWLVELEDDELAEKLACEYGLDEDQIENVRKISLPQRYVSFSRKAIKKLLPLMEEGKRADEALDAVYPDRNKEIDIAEVDKLPLPEDVRNPIVNRALFEVRKVVNAIVREYGKPEKIQIEMARDVRGNARERRELHFKMLENERRNKKVRERLIEMGVLKPKRDDVIKYKLWEECGHICPYTGKHISQVALFGENTEFQIEHILPYDRSLDDSFINKTLCQVQENIHVKRNQTPYEAYSHDPEKFEELKQRVNRTAMPYWKKRKFWQKEINTDEIISRELNDTRYICREVVKYLKQLCKNVRGTRGKVTAELAYQWGFVKDRDDHRHHTIDAAVVAVTKNKHLRQLGKSKYSKEGLAFAPPWQHFREELAEKVKHINVSHRVSRKVSGALHKETSYGPTGEENKYVFRKHLDELTLPMVKNIVDDTVREIVKKRLIDKGINPNEKGDRKIPKEVWTEPLYMTQTKSIKKVPIKKVRVYNVARNVIAIKDHSSKPYRFVEPGSNHHIEIFEYTYPEKKGERDSKVVTMFEAVRRSIDGKSVVQKNHGEDTQFVCSLANNDMVMMPNKNGDMDLYRVQKMSINKQIYFRHHTSATINDDSTLIRKQASLFKGYKVTVDPLGRIWPARD